VVVDTIDDTPAPLARSLSDGVFPSVTLADLAHRSQSVVRQATGGQGGWDRSDFEPNNLSILFDSIVGYPPPVDLLRILPGNDLINNQPLAVILGQLYFRAKLMTNLPVFARWSVSKKSIWATKLNKFAEVLIAVLHRRATDRDWIDADLAVVNVFILLQCLPSTILLPLFNIRKESRPFVVRTPDGTRIHLFSSAVGSEMDATDVGDDGELFSTGAKTRPVPRSQHVGRSVRFNALESLDLEAGGKSILKAAYKALNDGRPERLVPILCGDGCAPRDVRTRDRVFSMLHSANSFPDLDEEGLLPLAFDDTLLKGVLLKQVKNLSSSLDAFGWSNSFLKGIFKSTLSISENLFAHAASVLAAAITSGELPPVLNFLNATGVLTPLNKQPVEKQLEDLRLGKDLQLRLTSQGTWLDKAAGRAVISSEPAMRATESLAPIQLGVGVSGGVEMKFAAVRTAHDCGMVIAAWDVVNAFFSVRREQMFMAVAHKVPEVYGNLLTSYGLVTPVIFSYEDEGVLVLEIMPSLEGARIGCIRASWLYCIVVQPVYELLSEEFDGVEIRAVIDDMTAMFEPPLDPGNADAWEDLYEKIWEFQERYRVLAGGLGLDLHPTKGGVLLPAHAPLPVRRQNLRIVQGLVEVGGAIGSKEFVDAFTATKEDQACKRIESILQISENHPQACMKLLTVSALHKLDHYLRLVPNRELAESFDRMISSARWRILTPAFAGAPPVMSPLQWAVADLLASNTISNGGCGQLQTALTSAVGAILHVHTALRDPFVAKLPATMRRSEQLAKSDLAQFLGLDSVDDHRTIGPLLHSSLAAMAGGGATLPFTHSRVKLQKIIVGAVMGDRAFELRTDMVRRTRAKAAFPSLADTTHLLAGMLRSQFGRNFDPDLSTPECRIDEPLKFIIFAREALGLVPLTLGAERLFDPVMGAEYSICKHSDVGFYNDSHGDHATSCEKHIALKYVNHTEMAVPYRKACARLGLLVSKPNPSTRELCKQFFTENQLRELLPKKPTKAALAIQEEALSVMVRLEDCGGDNLARETILREMLAVMRRAVVRDGGAILTLDALITDDDGNEAVVDQTIVHHTAKSHLPSSARWFLAMHDAEVEARALGSAVLPQNTRLISGPVVARENFKVAKYEPLMRLLKLLMVIGRREVMPNFFAPSYSSSGEFSDGVFRLCEFFVPTVYRRAVDVQSYSGVTPKEAVREFRQFYYNCTAASLAKCNANVLQWAALSAGAPLDTGLSGRAHWTLAPRGWGSGPRSGGGVGGRVCGGGSGKGSGMVGGKGRGRGRGSRGGTEGVAVGNVISSRSGGVVDGARRLGPVVFATGGSGTRRLGGRGKGVSVGGGNGGLSVVVGGDLDPESGMRVDPSTSVTPEGSAAALGAAEAATRAVDELEG
jgi:hypothetical protein